MTRDGQRASRMGGFTLVEVVVSLSVLLVSTLALGFAVQAGAMATRELREDQLVLARAETYVDRLNAQSFGHSYDPDPTASQIQEAFDDDCDPGDVSLCQLIRSPSADGGWKFQLTGFPVDGEWRISVDGDLNGDGAVDGALETGDRVLRIRVFFNDRLILETCRGKEVKL